MQTVDRFATDASVCKLPSFLGGTIPAAQMCGGMNVAVQVSADFTGCASITCSLGPDHVVLVVQDLANMPMVSRTCRDVGRFCEMNVESTCLQRILGINLHELILYQYTFHRNTGSYASRIYICFTCSMNSLKHDPH